MILNNNYINSVNIFLLYDIHTLHPSFSHLQQHDIFMFCIVMIMIMIMMIIIIC